MTYYIAMDVGGTHGRLLVADEAGSTLLSTESLGGTIPSVGRVEMEKRLRQLILPALSEAKLDPADCAGLCMGASGIDTPELGDAYIEILTNMNFPLSCIQAYNDCEMLLALADGPAVAVISGTGSIATGRLGAGQPIQRCGGWSYVLSDEGSAMDISFCAMKALLRHFDGQENCPVMARLFAEKYGFDEAERVVEWCHSNLLNKEKLAGLATIAAEAAEAGEETAIGILSGRGEVLASFVTNVAGKLGIRETPHAVILWGSVLMQNAIVRESLIGKLRAEDPCGEVRLLTSTAIECALSLAMKQRENLY